MEPMKVRIQETGDIDDLSQYDENARSFISEHSDCFKGISYDEMYDVFTMNYDEYVFWQSAISNQRTLNSLSGFIKERYGQSKIDGLLADVNASDMSWSDKLEAEVKALRDFIHSSPRY